MGLMSGMEAEGRGPAGVGMGGGTAAVGGEVAVLSGGGAAAGGEVLGGVTVG